MKLEQLRKMNASEITIWCSTNPRTAADLIGKLITEIDHLKEMLTPTRTEEPGWPADCVMHDCHECRCTREECSRT